MNVNKIKLVAQVVGLATLALLATYGVIVALGGPLPLLAQGLPGSSNVPLYINYQGTLKDPLGEPVTGVYTMTVSIYDQVAGGNELWSEEHGSVTVREGRFSMILGDGSSRSGDLTPSLFNVPERYIALTVDGVEMAPRQRFVSVAYAMSAAFVTRLSAPDGDPADAVVVDDAGSVGIGTGSPQARLHVSGNSILTGRVGIGTTAPGAKLEIVGGGGNSVDLVVNGRLRSSSDDGGLWVADDRFIGGWGADRVGFYSDGYWRLVVQSDGKVGIAEMYPTTMLDVNGNTHISGDLTVDGTINTKLTVYGPYTAESNSTVSGDTTMRPSSDSVCFLTVFHQNTYGYATESGTCVVRVHSDGYWHLSATSQPAGYSYTEVWCEAHCLSW